MCLAAYVLNAKVKQERRETLQTYKEAEVRLGVVSWAPILAMGDGNS